MSGDFKQKIYYGFVTETIPSLSVPCPHGETSKVGSIRCRECEYFKEENESDYYIICSRKPKLLEALEELVELIDMGMEAPQIHGSDLHAKAALILSKAYGESQ
jgi:hypothetical protein